MKTTNSYIAGLVVLVVMLVPHANVFAQSSWSLPFEWVKPLGAPDTPNASPYFRSLIDVKLGPEGSIYAIGYDGETSQIVKHSPEGIKLWEKSFLVYFNSLDVDDDGNVYVGGWGRNIVDFNTSASRGSVFTPDAALRDRTSPEMLLVKFDAEGVFQWLQYDSNVYFTDVYSLVTAVHVASDGDVIVGGNFLNNLDVDGPGVTSVGQLQGSSNLEEGADIFVARFTPGGILEWATQSTSSGNFGSRNLKAISTNNAGDIYLTGSFITNMTWPSPLAGPYVHASSQNRAMFLVKLTSAGYSLWVQIANELYPSDCCLPNSEMGHGVVTGEDGSVYVVGQMGGEVPLGVPGSIITKLVDFDGPTTTGSGGEVEIISGVDIFLAKYTDQGVLEWVQGAGGYGLDVGRDMAIHGDKLFMTGFVSEYTIADFDGEDLSGQGGEIEYDGSSNGFVASYSVNGAFEWAFPLSGDVNQGMSIDVNGKKMVLAGLVDVSAIFDDRNVIYGPSGFLAQYSLDTGVNTKPVTLGSTSGSAYPNPFNPQTQFKLLVDEWQYVEIAVFDLLGRQVALLHRGELTPNVFHQFTFKAGNLPSGTYLIRAQGQRFVQSKRVVLLK